jgi:hypothetical protein
MTEPRRTDTQPIAGLPFANGGRAPHRDGLTAEQVRRMLRRDEARHRTHDTRQIGHCMQCLTCGVRLGSAAGRRKGE